MNTVMFVMRILAPLAMIGTSAMIFYQHIYPGDGKSGVSRAVWLILAIVLLVDGIWLVLRR